MNSAILPEVTPVPDRLRTPRHWLVFAAVVVGLTMVAHLLDQVAWEQVRDLRVNDKDWGRLLRSMGYAPTWLIIAGGFWLQDRGAKGWGWRGGLVALAPALSGGLAELLKIVIRRQRPSPDAFGYVFRPFSEDLMSTRGLGVPSSHVAVAFAGAAVLSRIFPRAWWLWYLLAAGCAATRVLAMGHFLSDVVVAAALGYAVGVLMARSGGFGRALS
jgi:membrane-associated phospholipid phosphatase